MLPQTPQLSSSVLVLAQSPLQQVCPAAQAVPQVPQLVSLVLRLAQVPSQQVWLEVQMFPHAPQDPARVKLVHAPLQQP
jgi:hypothetical protein